MTGNELRVKSVGIDIVEIARLELDIERYGERFLKRILSVDEITKYEDRVDKMQFLAGRFAAKEAIIKALGAYLKTKPALNQVVIENDASGQPQVVWPVELQKVLNGTRCLISISHEKNYAVAFAAFVEE